MLYKEIDEINWRRDQPLSSPNKTLRDRAMAKKWNVCLKCMKNWVVVQKWLRQRGQNKKLSFQYFFAGGHFCLCWIFFNFFTIYFLVLSAKRKDGQVRCTLNRITPHNDVDERCMYDIGYTKCALPFKVSFILYRTRMISCSFDRCS